MSNTELLTKVEVMNFMMEAITHHTKVLSFPDADLAFRIQKYLKDPTNLDIDSQINAENCGFILISFLNVIQKQAGFTLPMAKVLNQMITFIENPSKPVRRVDLQIINENDDYISLNELKVQNRYLQEKIAELESRVAEMYYAPGMPGYEVAKESFEMRQQSSQNIKNRHKEHIKSNKHVE